MKSNVTILEPPSLARNIGTNYFKLYLITFGLIVAPTVIAAPVSINPRLAALAKLDKRYYEAVCGSWDQYCLNTTGINTLCSFSHVQSNAWQCEANCRCYPPGCGVHLCKGVEGADAASTTETAKTEATVAV